MSGKALIAVAVAAALVLAAGYAVLGEDEATAATPVGNAAHARFQIDLSAPSRHPPRN